MLATFKVMGREVPGEAEVVAFEAGRLIRYRFEQPTMGLKPTLDYRFEPTPAGTRFTRRVDAETSGIMRILGPLMKPMMGRSNAGFLRNLKQTLESRA
jgi:hypothetical protein